MYNFKHKNLKKIVICKKKNTTLDAKHKELTDKFRHELTEILPKLEREQLELQNKLNDNAISLPIEIRLDLIDTLKNIKLKIKNIKINKK